METLIQILVGCAGLMLTGLGVMSMFAPQKMTANFSLQPVGIPGFSTLRSVMGGLFLASAALLATGFATGQTHWYLAVAVLMAAVAVGRVVSLLADGADKAVVPPLLVELVIIAVLVSAHMTSGAA